MNRILVIDNYDSFTYNLVHYLKALDAEVDVFRNDKISVANASEYKSIVLSPGPGLPKDAGIMPQLIKALAPTHKILGVCLGHQAIAEAFGNSLYNLEKVYHGLATPCDIVVPDGLFTGLPERFKVGRYHSWNVSLPITDDLEITAMDTETGSIMALKHRLYNIRGVQFHPESVLTEYGMEMMKNWLVNCN